MPTDLRPHLEVLQGKTLHTVARHKATVNPITLRHRPT